MKGTEWLDKAHKLPALWLGQFGPYRHAAADHAVYQLHLVDVLLAFFAIGYEEISLHVVTLHKRDSKDPTANCETRVRFGPQPCDEPVSTQP